MSLLLSSSALPVRRTIATGGLRSLAASLAADLDDVLAHPLYVPEEKALLSREGGRCPRHGILLEFDPWSPHEHRCPVDGEAFRGVFHDRFWIYWYQLWLAERAVHAGTLFLLGGDRRYAGLAAAILAAYADDYLTYPNVDNVLGPTRPFFSTYLESIWTLHLSVALDLLESSSGPDEFRELGARVRERVLEPSVELIASYDEGTSNRQVWNNAALLASSVVLGRPAGVDAAINGSSGVLRHLRDAVLADGTWYEGENYHLFAHRGLWYAIAMADRLGAAIPSGLLSRFDEGFATPFEVALPDFTLPARRDSQYGIALRQWRFAELCELGLARHADDRLTHALARVYSGDAPPGRTGRWRSSADVERNERAVRLTRSDLGWRSLLFAREELPPLVPSVPRSTLLRGQGLAVLRRRDGEVFVALDYGHSGGGHGHPDRLNVVLAQGETHWLDDVGTGSYVDPSLHWYRSTLAHNAPLANGRSQWRGDGRLVAFADDGEFGWVEATAEIADGVRTTRSLVTTADYVLDQVGWVGTEGGMLDLPMHVEIESSADSLGFEPAPLRGEEGEEDGFVFVHDTERALRLAGVVTHFRGRAERGALDLWLTSSVDVELWRCVAPGPPGSAERPFLLVRGRGGAGTVRVVASWSGAVVRATFEPTLAVELVSGTAHTHVRTLEGWRIDVDGSRGQGARSARRTIVLGGLEHRDSERSMSPRVPGRPVIKPALDLRRGAALHWELGEANYRRSEQSWGDAGEPTADLTLGWVGEEFVLRVAVHHVDRTFVPEGQINPFDNEHADVNGAGLQLYCGVGAAEPEGWLLVPIEGDDAVRIRPIAAGSTSTLRVIHAVWGPLADGYAIEAHLGSNVILKDNDLLRLDVVVNEKPFGRVRRRGQLVLGGGRGEFVYLRGDRHDADHFLAIRLRDG